MATLQAAITKGKQSTKAKLMALLWGKEVHEYINKPKDAPRKKKKKKTEKGSPRQQGGVTADWHCLKDNLAIITLIYSHLI